VFGSTEEGALDDIEGIEKARQSLERQGLTTWLHVDACYGGYLGSLARCREAAAITDPEQLQQWLLDISDQCGLDKSSATKYVTLSDQPGWLSWGQLLQRIDGLRHADSISIDPHKLGYIPYPAGAVLLRDKNAWETVNFTAPYLWISQGSSFVGRYTLEGSRPGAAAASCWLAHKAVPLSQEGHGKLVAASVLATRQLYTTLAEVSHPKVEIAFLNCPHLNMLIYIPYHKESRNIDEICEVARRVRDELEPTHKKDFMVVGTDVHVELTADKIKTMFTGPVGDRLASSERLPRGQQLSVLRSVVMGPLSLNARHRPTGRTLFQLYADELCRLTEEHYSRFRNEQLVRSFEEGEAVLVMDDHKPTLDWLRGVFGGLYQGELGSYVKYTQTPNEAAKVVTNHDRPLRFAVLDIDMGETQPDGGYQIFERICERNDSQRNESYRVQNVLFLTLGDQANKRRCREIAQRFQHPPTWAYIEKREIKVAADVDFLERFKQRLFGDG
jgi:hypothetical protein